MEQELMFSLLWLMLILGCTSRVESSVSIFILAGQSNMVGEGGVVNNVWDGVVPMESQANPMILRLNNDLSWEEAQEPLFQSNDAGVCGVGPGMAFANSLLKRVGPNIGQIGLVPCAVGGTKISQWMRGTDLYNRMLTRAQAAVSGSGGGMIRAVLWYQGEADTENNDDATLYKSRLSQFLTDLRSDLQSPSLPVIQVALASGSNEYYMELVRQAQLNTGLQGVATVDAKGLELEPDYVHLTTTSQVTLGAMLADAFIQTAGLG